MHEENEVGIRAAIEWPPTNNSLGYDQRRDPENDDGWTEPMKTGNIVQA